VRYDRYAVGLHHLALSASSRSAFDERADWLRAHGAQIEAVLRSTLHARPVELGERGAFEHDVGPSPQVPQLVFVEVASAALRGGGELGRCASALVRP
jgi:hypothetical protein